MKAAPYAAALGFGFASVGFILGDAEGATQLPTLTAYSDGEKRAGIVAVKIRHQGYHCDTPLGLESDRERSMPHETVWILKCRHATYRVRLIPDMAAHIEHLN